MEKVNIICVDDQREVLDAVLKDLAPLSAVFHIEDCESADEALALIDDLDADGEHIALIISDHVMPEKTGVELLTEVSLDPRFRATRKVLLTGQATHADTIEAINNARIERYFEKPWQAASLQEAAKKLVTHFVFDAGLDYRDYQECLDTQVIFDRLK
ncbi:response regulator [Enterovibrio makurazakiensis]|uniref:Response regulator n=1 Tax=Enterovibrio gelatinilyticus TaxID=2899819 RepID=A0ABT5R621_9GAMM|nr:response regulator [Enterovibrio sp. ZSDZ42]MDD1795725.1 response regulator [Enterovibrio sp. ZSDZ42]